MKLSKPIIFLQLLLILTVISSCKKSSTSSGVTGTSWTVNQVITSGPGVGNLLNSFNVYFGSGGVLSNYAGQPSGWTNASWSQTGNTVTFSMQYYGGNSTTVTETYTGTIYNSTAMTGTFSNSALGSGTMTATEQ